MELIQVAAGRKYTMAVRDAVRAAKNEEALAPVRVLVPSNTAGLSLRRMLGSHLLDGPDGFDGLEPGTTRPAGIANVSFSTPFQYASLLAAPRLAVSGQRPLTTAVLAAAVRHVLGSEPGRFGDVADHVATESALIRAYAEITEMPPNRRRALAAAASPRTCDLLNFVEAVGEHLHRGTTHRYHDEYAVLTAAAEALDPATSESLVFAGPFTQGLATLEFLGEVARLIPGYGVFALTGDETVDAATAEQAGAISGAPVQLERIALPLPTTLIPVADSDEEVRAVVRRILTAADRGVRFDRMAVFVPNQDPYLRTVREQFARAGIPAAGPDHRTLGDSMTGRLLHRLLHLVDASIAVSADKQFERETVLALVEAAPLRGPNGKAIRSGAWENLSRKAGVVSGLDDWSHRLGSLVDSLTKRIEDNEADASPGYLTGLERERVAAQQLSEFVGWLAELTEPSRVGRLWSERAQWARETLALLLPRPNQRRRWPETEIEAAERVDAILSRVGVLDEVEPHLTSSAFQRAIQLELGVPAGRRGRFGTGVFVSPLSTAVGLDLDEVYILGMAEGVCPRPIREDTLLPDTERAATAGALPLRADLIREERQRYLHALASGENAVTLMSPRGDHRSGRSRTASRWWVEAVRLLDDDDTLNSQNWEAQDRFADLGLGSFDEALTTALRDGLATSVSDLQLHHVHAKSRFDQELRSDALAKPLERGLEQIDYRLEGFNRFSGDLSEVELRSPLAGGQAISSSRLERWSSCPRQFYFEHMLRLGEIERPEEITEISALDKGNLWHQILEDFIRESLPGAEHELTDPDHVWTDADRARLRGHAERRYKEYEDLGRTGRPILWAIRKEEINADLEAFLRSDEDLRMALRSVPADVELPFGLPRRGPGDEALAAEITIGDGRSIRLRGLIDRVDRRTDGVPVVLDYKTGKATSQKTFDGDPVVGGTKLQLGVYAEAAAQHFGTDTAHAYYWFTSARGGFKHVGYPWTAERSERFTDAVNTIVAGIERGDFPPNPGEFNSFYSNFGSCNYCPFTRICPVDRDEEFEQAVKSGRLVDYVNMLEPPDLEQSDGGSR